MTNEIKEIIKLGCEEEIEVKYFAKDDSLVNTYMDYDQLLDYITNLQEENEKLKNLYTNDKNHKIDYNYFKVLYSKADKGIVIDDLVYKCEQCRVLYDSAEKNSFENYNLQERIDKAIEYINKYEYQKYCPSPYEKDKYIMREEKEGQDLLNILRGDE